MLRNILLLTFGILGLMLVLAFCTTDTAQREEPSAAVVVDLFDRMAFSGYGEAGATGQGPILRRWTEPVRIAVIGGPEDEGRMRLWHKGVEGMAELYDVLPNLDVAVVETAPFALDGEAVDEVEVARQAANLVVWTVPEDAVQEFIADVGLPPEAAAELGSSRDGCAVVGARMAVLSSAAIILRGDLGQAKQRTCLGESLATALGFHIQEKHIPDVFRSRQDSLTFHPLGRMAASLVYDPALQAGMPRADALVAARDVLKSKGLE